MHRRAAFVMGVKDAPCTTVLAQAGDVAFVICDQVKSERDKPGRAVNFLHPHPISALPHFEANPPQTAHGAGKSPPLPHGPCAQRR
ncbi:hypothetical protein ACEN2S_19550 [Phaeovulum sp. W22_SRMD_FR3]